MSSVPLKPLCFWRLKVGGFGNGTFMVFMSVCDLGLWVSEIIYKIRVGVLVCRPPVSIIIIIMM